MDLAPSNLLSSFTYQLPRLTPLSSLNCFQFWAALLPICLVPRPSLLPLSGRCAEAIFHVSLVSQPWYLLHGARIVCSSVSSGAARQELSDLSTWPAQDTEWVPGTGLLMGPGHHHTQGPPLRLEQVWTCDKKPHWFCEQCRGGRNGLQKQDYSANLNTALTSQG